jgi:hypothetical protein
VSKLGAANNPFKLPNLVMPNLNADGNTNTTTKADKSKEYDTYQEETVNVSRSSPEHLVTSSSSAQAMHTPTL